MSTEEEKGVYILKSACADDSVYLQKWGVDTHICVRSGEEHGVVAPTPCSSSHRYRTSIPQEVL